MKRLISVIALVAATLMAPTAAHSAEMIVKPAKTTDLGAEESISVVLEKFPSKAGVYLQQCAQPAAGARPSDCNAQTQLWITGARGGSFLPTDAITMKLVAKFGAVDCTVQKCGIFARYDHTAGADLSEDQFIPITFGSGTSVVAAPTKTPVKQSIGALPKSLKTGKSLSLPLQTEQGSTISYRVAANKFCSLKANVVRALKPGNCKLQIFAPASSDLEMFALNYKLQIKR